jgi:hypothetical protein
MGMFILIAVLVVCIRFLLAENLLRPAFSILLESWVLLELVGCDHNIDGQVEDWININPAVTDPVILE